MSEIDLTKWHQVGAVQQKLYPSGDLLIVRPWTRGWTAEQYAANTGRHYGYPVKLEDEMTEEQVKDALDKRFDPQPDTILGGRQAGMDWTVYVHGNRLACVDRLGSRWFFNRAGYFAKETETRDEAESAARDYVLGNS